MIVYSSTISTRTSCHKVGLEQRLRRVRDRGGRGGAGERGKEALLGSSRSWQFNSIRSAPPQVRVSVRGRGRVPGKNDRSVTSKLGWTAGSRDTTELSALGDASTTLMPTAERVGAGRMNEAAGACSPSASETVAIMCRPSFVNRSDRKTEISG